MVSSFQIFIRYFCHLALGGHPSRAFLLSKQNKKSCMSWLFVVMFFTSSYFTGEVVLCDGDLNLVYRFLMQVFVGVESFGEGAILADAQAYPPYG